MGTETLRDMHTNINGTSNEWLGQIQSIQHLFYVVTDRFGSGIFIELIQLVHSIEYKGLYRLVRAILDAENRNVNLHVLDPASKHMNKMVPETSEKSVVEDQGMTGTYISAWIDQIGAVLLM